MFGVIIVVVVVVVGFTVVELLTYRDMISFGAQFEIKRLFMKLIHCNSLQTAHVNCV